MGRPARLPSRERRDAIVTAVRDMFAEKGFDGTTTRELAQAAGVSEALLYKHFPSKESLYGAMLDACAEGPLAAEWGRVLANLIGFPGLLFYLWLLFGMVMLLRHTVDDLRHESYADAYLVVARTQLFLFMLNELKIDFLRNPIYQYQVWMWFGTWTAAALVSREDGVRAGAYDGELAGALGRIHGAVRRGTSGGERLRSAVLPGRSRNRDIVPEFR